MVAVNGLRSVGRARLAAMTDVGRQLATNAASTRSPLRRWLFEHQDEIAAVLATQGRPGWQALTRTAAANNVTDEKGAAYTADAVRKAWQAIERTRNEKEQNRLQQIPANPPYQPQVFETQPVQKPPVMTPQPAASPTKRRFDIKPATFKD
jgi:hypothetical protein